MTTPTQQPASDVAQTAVGGGTLATSATAIVACAACCALPLLVPALAVGASGAVLAWLAGAHAWLRIIAALAVVAAWAWLVWERAAKGRRVRPMTWVLLSISTVMAVIAFFWAAIEPHLMKLWA